MTTHFSLSSDPDRNSQLLDGDKTNLNDPGLQNFSLNLSWKWITIPFFFFTKVMHLQDVLFILNHHPFVLVPVCHTSWRQRPSVMMNVCDSRSEAQQASASSPRCLQHVTQGADQPSTCMKTTANVPYARSLYKESTNLSRRLTLTQHTAITQFMSRGTVLINLT